MHQSLQTIVLLLLIILFSDANAVTLSDVQFDNFSIADGLSNDSITDIVEDSHGFVWFATFDGLNRFDGYRFKQYKHNPNDPNSIPNHFIRQLFIDSQKRLWAVTFNGLARYVPERDHFIVYNSRNHGFSSDKFWTVAELQDGSLLAAEESSLYRLAPGAESFQPYQFAGSELLNEVKVIQDEHTRTWFGTYGHGLFQLDKNSGVLQQLQLSAAGETANFLLDWQKVDGHYWLATEIGLWQLDQNNQVIRHYSGQTTPAIAGNQVRSLALDQTQRGLWIGTEQGISHLSLDDGEIFTINQDSHHQTALSHPFITKVFIDRNSSLWVGAYAGGANKHNAKTSAIKHYTATLGKPFGLSGKLVWALRQGPDQQIWIATQNGGINAFDPNTGKFSYHLQDFEHNIWDLVIDQQGRFWLGTSNGVYRFELQQGQLQQRAHLLAGTSVDVLLQDQQTLWVASESAILTGIDLKTDSIRSHNIQSGVIQYIRPALVSEDGTLWLITNLGLSKFNRNSGQLDQLIISLNDDSVRFSSLRESADAYWASTYEHGLLELDKQTLSIRRHYSQANGLQSNTVIGTLVSDNYVWAANLYGINQIERKSGKITQRITEQLLDFSSLNENANLLSNSGVLYFGGGTGMHRINPTKLLDGHSPLSQPPLFTELRIFNKPVTALGTDSQLCMPIELADTLYLNNSDSPFSIEFTQVNALYPDAVNYRYRLNGNDKGWIQADASIRQATYTNVPFGTYEFEAQARLNDGPWTDSRTIKVKVAPPLWFHSNALVLYGIVSLMLVLYWWRQIKTKRAVHKQIKDNEERLKLTLWSSGDELWDWDIQNQQVHRSNTWGTLDFPQDNMRVNSAYEANVHPGDLNRLTQALADHLDGNSEHFEVSYRLKTFKGEWIWILDRGKVVERDSAGNALRMTGTLKNVHQEKSAEEQLKLFKKSIETISDGVFIANREFKFISVNNAYCAYTGQTREQALATHLHFHQYPDAFTEEVKKTLIHRGNWSGELESVRANGERYEIDLNIDVLKDEDNNITHFVGVFSDITARKITEKELLKLANSDPLTNLPNRSFFMASHDNLVRKNINHALICLDMDNFKKVNDSMGHETGDMLIQQIATRLQKITGNNATCYRLGGDEFSMLVDKTTDIHRITHFSQYVLDEMARPFVIDKQEFVLGGSLGIAFYPGDGNSPQELLKNADTAMYFAKNSGGNRYQFFSGEMNQSAVRQLQIENLIRRGLKEDLFSVYYQPKVDIFTGKLVSMEALVRFEHPDKGIVTPGQFIPLAEQTGQIIQIGEAVLRKACSDTQRWVRAGLFSGRVAVNISARQFELPDLDDRIERVLKQTGLSPLHLECEITEGTLMQQPEQSLAMMKRLRERGIHLALDDFGTGYSSLAYLKQFPLNTLKIDKAFIDGIATSSVDRHMTSAIITIAHNLGLKVVAEGVEQEKQLAILRRYECEMLQGYLYSKPLSADRFERLLAESQTLAPFLPHASFTEQNQ